MEIPFTVKPRPDTGLWNAKVGIWLFLASEVMLFGGLFSGYLFLRLGAGGEPDYFWPKDVLSVPFGFVNTLILKKFPKVSDVDVCSSSLCFYFLNK